MRLFDNHEFEEWLTKATPYERLLINEIKSMCENESDNEQIHYELTEQKDVFTATFINRSGTSELRVFGLHRNPETGQLEAFIVNPVHNENTHDQHESHLHYTEGTIPTSDTGDGNPTLKKYISIVGDKLGVIFLLAIFAIPALNILEHVVDGLESGALTVAVASILVIVGFGRGSFLYGRRLVAGNLMLNRDSVALTVVFLWAVSLTLLLFLWAQPFEEARASPDFITLVTAIITIISFKSGVDTGNKDQEEYKRKMSKENTTT